MTARTALEIADTIVDDLHRWPERKEAAAMLLQQHAEIERLQSRFDSNKFTHRQDCCGAQIETRCLGCAMADLNCSMAEADTMRAEIARLTGDNVVLRGLVRDAFDVLDTLYGEDFGECKKIAELQERITAALNGKSDGLFADPSDGEIYAAASRRANPEAHAAIHKQMEQISRRSNNETHDGAATNQSGFADEPRTGGH